MQLAGMCVDLTIMLSLLFSIEAASAFCGTYAGTAGTSLTNQTSQMVVAIQDGRSTLTVWSDDQGELADFARLIPVPAGLQPEQVGVVDRAWVEELEVFSSPRMASYTCSDALEVFHDGPSVNGCGRLLGCS